MEKYNYLQAVRDDLRDFYNDNKSSFEGLDRDEFTDKLNELAWTSDSVTGNGSGSYTFSSWQAEENICHNIDLLVEALEDFGQTGCDILEKGAESCDVIIRCYLLGDAISELADELESAGVFDENENEGND